MGDGAKRKAVTRFTCFGATRVPARQLVHVMPQDFAHTAWLLLLPPVVGRSFALHPAAQSRSAKMLAMAPSLNSTV